MHSARQTSEATRFVRGKLPRTRGQRPMLPRTQYSLKGGSRMISNPRGDMPPEEFRKHLHQLADWIADFREHIEQLHVAPDKKPGAIRAQIPRRAPDEGESFERI